MMNGSLFPRATVRTPVFVLAACLLATCLLPAAASPARAADTVVIQPPRLSAEHEQEKRQVLGVLRQAAEVASGLYRESFGVAWSAAGIEADDGAAGNGKGVGADGKADGAGDGADDGADGKGVGGADFTVAVAGSVQGKDSALTLITTRSADGASSPSLAVIGEITGERTRCIANILLYQWASFSDYFASRIGAPAAFVDELPAEMLSHSVQASFNVMLMPTSMAVKAGGNLLVGFSSVCLEMDRHFRVLSQPGQQLLDSGNTLYAYNVGVTPGDTIIFKPSMGREMYRLTPGAPRPERWRTGMDVQGLFTVAADGSAVIADTINRRAVRLLGRKRYELDLFPREYSYVAAVAAGPEETIWVYDGFEKRVRIHTLDGDLIDSIMLIADQSRRIMPTSMAVFADGRFVLFTPGELLCFRRDGTMAWRVSEIPEAETDVLSQMAAVAVDSASGAIYVADLMGKRILKFLDREYARRVKADCTLEEKIIELNRRQVRGGRDPGPTEEKAVLYEQAGAYEMAKALWDRILYQDPYNARAQSKIDDLDVLILKRKVAGMRERTIELLDTLGPESARRLYAQSLQLYERILSLRPDDEETRRDFEDLKRRFLQRSTVPSSGSRPITVAGIRLDNLFPSLMQHYRDSPAGSVRVENSLDEPVRNLEASVFIRRYMDFPVEQRGPAVLEPGETVELELRVLFNDRIFQLQEDLPVQAGIEVRYTAGGEERVVARQVPVTIYRRTALAWDDSGKLASFIMPNEGIVSRFAHRVSRLERGGASERYRISERFFRAVRICDALGVYGIHYIEDPESPFSRVLGKAEVVDTVRFPRTTLLIGSGDCDDTSALLGSLLESVGIRTAVMTSPGHVFLAFDTGEPEENLWLFDRSGLEAMRYAGTVWIPVETTLLEEGFFRAWAEASSLVQQYEPAGRIEFLPVFALRDSYPPLPLPESNFTVVEPAAEALDARYEGSVDVVVRSIYRNGLESLQERLADEGGRGRRAIRIRNQIGVLHARFGRDEKAEEVLRGCVAADPDFLSSYINLANLMVSRNQLDGALAVARSGLDRNPESVLLNLLMARISLRRGDRREALDYYRAVKRKSSHLAERFADLFAGLDGSGDGGRAGVPKDDFEMIWDSGE